ncbi:MAG TPA: hypothetical protein DDX98_01210 [Bacteroidales bacterium]|jgi:hypothetical protein|nr:hypothetical protein [Bacteroidales bacterium]
MKRKKQESEEVLLTKMHLMSMEMNELSSELTKVGNKWAKQNCPFKKDDIFENVWFVRYYKKKMIVKSVGFVNEGSYANPKFSWKMEVAVLKMDGTPSNHVIRVSRSEYKSGVLMYNAPRYKRIPV